MNQPILFYGIEGEFGFLSNFYNAIFTLEDQQWPTVEHWFQAMKATTVEDRRRVASASGPGRAKKIGRSITCRSDWENVVGTADLHGIFRDSRGVVVELVKDHYMYSALIAKFTQRSELRQALLLTGDRPLIEDSPTDYYWGRGAKGTGQNKLGRMLQLVRSKLSEP
jgi:hypothetical protein